MCIDCILSGENQFSLSLSPNKAVPAIFEPTDPVIHRMGASTDARGAEADKRVYGRTNKGTKGLRGCNTPLTETLGFVVGLVQTRFYGGFCKVGKRQDSATLSKRYCASPVLLRLFSTKL